MKLEILTPVHIGSGDKYLSMDFVIKGNRVVFIDPMKFFEEIEKKGLDPVDVAKEIGEGKKSIEDFVKDLSKIKTREIAFNGRTPRREILAHIKSREKPYIPGSSIKGAIRTAILWKEVNENRKLLEWTINHIKEKLRRSKKGYLEKRDLTRLDDELEEKVFRKARLTEKRGNPKNDLLRALRIYDSEFIDGFSVYQINFLGMRNFSVLAECLDAGQRAKVEVDIDEFALQYLSQKLDYDYILSVTREFAEKIVEVEVNRNYPPEVKREFKNVLRANGIILRLGWGTGWYSSTIGTLLKTHPEFESIRKKIGLGRNPRTGRFSRDFPLIRRITSDSRPLGWISIHE
ncbi:type III-A CRISPR-associated RAMP protein Csm5 [Archaeoglobales archaeon]|nr:MAG: type III-A CRISPR-associated RAMP protein Csm5 [Archaeoglobales archaeon]